MSTIQIKNVSFDTNLELFNELINAGFLLHGHICPAMPLGLRASIEAMKRLGVNRAKNKELYVVIENGPAHAALCFSEGVQLGTSATFGKGMIERTNEGKNAFTIIDKLNKKEMRVSIKYPFFEKMMNSPFVKMRKEGIEPYNIDQNLPLTMIQNMLHVPADEIFNFSNVEDIEMKEVKGTFNYKQCDSCKEPVYESGIFNIGTKLLCTSCKQIDSL